MHLSVKALFLIAASIQLGFGQSYILDTNFNARISGPLADTLGVQAVAIQPDGKLIIGGAFTEVGEVERNGIARLHPDGTVDETFDPGAGVDNEVNAVLLQPDGKVLIGGRFSTVNGFSMQGMARLNADGSFDHEWTAFLSTVTTVLMVQQLEFDENGEVLMSGFFTHVSGMLRVCLAKVSTESVVSAYNPQPNNGVIGLYRDAQNRLVIGGGFDAVGGIPQRRLSRILPTGGVDGTFNVGSGPDNIVYTTGDGGGGRVLIGGGFTNVNGVLQKGLARLEANGALDLTFKPKFNGEFVLVFKTLLLANGKVMVGGYWGDIDGIERRALARLNSDGTVDQSFNAGIIDDAVTEILLDWSGNLYVGGYFNQIAGSNMPGLVRFKQELPADVRIQEIRRVGGTLIVSVSTEAGFNYALERRSAVHEGNWLRLETIAGTGIVVSFAPLNGAGEGGFFRVAVE